jgi:hypothetical protein
LKLCTVADENPAATAVTVWRPSKFWAEKVICPSSLVKPWYGDCASTDKVTKAFPIAPPPVENTDTFTAPSTSSPHTPPNRVPGLK